MAIALTLNSCVRVSVCARVCVCVCERDQLISLHVGTVLQCGMYSRFKQTMTGLGSRLLKAGLGLYCAFVLI